MFSEDFLLQTARFIGIAGLILFIVSGVGGALMASRTVQMINVRWLRGKVFKFHRLVSLTGAALFLLHPVPMLFAPMTTGGMNIYHSLIPFIAPKQALTISLGIISFWILLVVSITSIFIKYMRRDWWRAVHYGTYIVISLGLIHGLLISGEFKEGEIFEVDEPEKILLMVLSAIALALPVGRLFLAKRFTPREKTV
ncbi:MAG: ferric reductase-like transmembrane domain-containing protein [Pyrinomonadaceae bacterium]